MCQWCFSQRWIWKQLSTHSCECCLIDTTIEYCYSTLTRILPPLLLRWLNVFICSKHTPLCSLFLPMYIHVYSVECRLRTSIMCVCDDHCDWEIVHGRISIDCCWMIPLEWKEQALNSLPLLRKLKMSLWVGYHRRPRIMPVKGCCLSPTTIFASLPWFATLWPA